MVAEPDYLWRNDGKLAFVDVSAASGILSVAPAFGLGVVTADLDQDGFPDIYVANDSVANNLFHNEGATSSAPSATSRWNRAWPTARMAARRPGWASPSATTTATASRICS
jgi:hypothetical protein